MNLEEYKRVDYTLKGENYRFLVVQDLEATNKRAFELLKLREPTGETEIIDECAGFNQADIPEMLNHVSTEHREKIREALKP